MFWSSSVTTPTGLSTLGAEMTPTMFLQLTTESLAGAAASRCPLHSNAIASALAFFMTCPFIATAADDYPCASAARRAAALRLSRPPPVIGRGPPPQSQITGGGE